jgi:Cellulose biosynthesis protein BcsS
MRSGLQFLVASAAIAVSSVVGANAADIPLYTKAIPAPAKIEYGNLYFGVDWTSHKSLAGYTGVLYAPQGMHLSGWRLSAFGLVGRYEYHGGDNGELFKGRFVSSDALVGWSHVFGNGAFTLQVGANYQDHRVKPSDPNNPVVGSKLGFKAQADLWFNPNQQTLIYGLASYSTAFNTYYAVGRVGYDFLKTEVYFGPEIGALGNDRTDQQRVGVHFTGIKVGPGKVTISGGWMHERGEGNGGYAAGSIDFSF